MYESGTGRQLWSDHKTGSTVKMNVTSLLNSEPTPTERRRRVGTAASRIPSRNRTPWDGGGYSLPVKTTANGIKSPLYQDQFKHHLNRTPISTPPLSPKHHFSGSCSSLSSLTSSVQPTEAHSRYSSISTVASSLQACQNSSDRRTNANVSWILDSVNIPFLIDQCQDNGPQKIKTWPQVECAAEEIALLATNHLAKQQMESRGREDGAVDVVAAYSIADDVAKAACYDRPSSPSDAVLIKRASIPGCQLNSEDSKEHRPQYSFQSAYHLETLHLHNRTHKRAASEPSFDHSKITHMFPNQAAKGPFASFLTNKFSRTEKLSTNYEERNSPLRSSITISSPQYIEDGQMCNTAITKRSSNHARRPSLIDMRRIAYDLPEAFQIADRSDTHTLIKSDSLDAPTSRIISVEDSHPKMELPSAPLLMSSRQDSIADLTPPSSHDLDNPDDIGPKSFPVHDSPIPLTATLQDDDNRPIVCEYVKDCDTGSQMRKAISHIFGRNKICTRQIPQNVWVHFCRKHYQRSRYRNPKEYTRTQCGLVLKQIIQIHEWYEAHRRGRGDDRLSWTLATRKREQKRIQDLERKETDKRKRSKNEGDDDGEGEDDCDHDHDPLTAVPAWLAAACGTRYSTSRIVEIFKQLESEVCNGLHTTTFPDIEVLPEIEPTVKEPKSPQGYKKRYSTPSSHRRAQSLGHLSNDSLAWKDEELPRPELPSHKRKRLNSGKIQDSLGINSRHNRTQSEVVPQKRVTRPKQSLHHRPRVIHSENHPEKDQELPLKDENSSYTTSSFHSFFPGRSPSHSPNYPSTPHLDDRNDFHGPIHGRSQSLNVPSRIHPSDRGSTTPYFHSGMEARPRHRSPREH